MPNAIEKVILAVKHSKLIKVRDASFTEGAVGLKMEFQFRTPDWDNKTKIAVFVRGRATPSTPSADITYAYLDENDECEIPPEMLADTKMFSAGVYGYEGEIATDDYLRIVSNWMCYRVNDGCYADGSTPAVPSQNTYDQIMDILKTKSDVGHDHDERYYTREEVENIVRYLMPKPISVTIYADKWVQDADDRWYQVVTVDNAVITERSKVDLQPSPEQLTIFHTKDLAFVTENEDGVVSVFCVGQVPTNDYTIQATTTEVAINV